MSPDKAPLLTINNLVKRFGGFRALDGLSLSIAPGEVLGLVGPNGSGKTTCINVISGLYPADGGEVLFEGKSISGTKSHHLVHLGINRTFQVPKPFLALTVRENIEVAIAYGNHPEGLVFSPNQLHLLVVNTGSGDMTVLSLIGENSKGRPRREAPSLETMIPLGKDPRAIVVKAFVSQR